MDAIPIRLAPLPGEDLDSYLQAYAHQLHAEVRDILELAGLAACWDANRRAHGYRPWANDLDPAERDALAAVTGAPAQALAEMTLARYDGTGLVTLDATTRSPRMPRWWRQLKGSRFCPRCLAGNGGRWMLAWRLPWTFACTHHHVLLADTCPACGRRHRPTPSRPPHSPGRCDTTGLALPQPAPVLPAPACSFPQADTETTPLAPGGSVVAAQRYIDTLTTAIVHAHRGDPGRLPAIQRHMDDLHTAARASLLALGTPATPPEAVTAALTELGTDAGEQHTGTGRQCVRDTALGTTAAYLMLGQRPGAPNPAITGWLADAAARRARPNPTRLLRRWKNASPELQGALLATRRPYLGAAGQLRYSTAANPYHRARAGNGKARAAAVPGLFWRGWTLRLNPPGLFTPLPYRTTLSALLLLAGTADLDYQHARALLGTTPASITNPCYFTRGLRRAGALDAVVSALGQLADALDEHGSPIDYARRRRLFTEPEFDGEAWHGHCLESRRPGLACPRQTTFARSYLAELLTGTHPCHLPGPAKLTAPEGTRYARSLTRLPAPLHTHLHDQAEQILRRAGICEPVEWEPPLDWVTGVTWPAPDPADTPRGDLWAHTPARPPSTAPAEPDTTASPPPPTPQDLHTYTERGFSPQMIASATGCPRPLVTRLLADAGLARPTARAVLPTLDPAWLREEYEGKHRTFSEIATELGIAPSTLSAHARTLGITSRRGGASRKHILASHGGPAAFPATVWAAFAGPRADQHIRRTLATPGHPDLGRAAKTLGIRRDSLAHQIRRVEQAVGTELLHHDIDGGGITLTPAGEQFARDTRPVLEILDHDTTSDDHGRRQELAK